METAPTPVRGHTPRSFSAGLITGLLVALAVGVTVIALDSNWPGSSDVVRGSGVSVERTRNVPSFTAVELAGANDVSVHVGGNQSVVVAADDNLIERVRTDVRHGTLVVLTDGDFSARTPMTVDVTVSKLEAVTLSGSGTITIDGVDTPKFDVDLPGSGTVTVAGFAERLDARLTGVGKLQLQELIARDVGATLSGAGEIEVHATHSLDASVSGTGSILYSGDPSEVATDVPGVGTIEEL